MNRFIALILIIITFGIIYAAPIWDATVYPTSTVAYGFVTIEGKAADTGDIVYGFVRRECRGKQQVKIAEDIAYMTMNIQGMDDHEPVYFKIWDASEDSIYEVNFTTYTKPNSDIGYPPDVLPINGVKQAVIFYFPPEDLEMHPYEVRQLDIGYYCNTTDGVKDIRFFGAENLQVLQEGFRLNISAISEWTGEEALEVEILNEAGEVLDYGTTIIKVTK